MASVDGNVNIKTKLDNSDLKKGTKEANNNLGSMIKSIKNFTIAGIGISAVTKAIGSLVSGIKDCTKAWEVQRNAELSLEAVARNNPYFNNEAVNGLKKFASELQSVSNYGDEYLMPLMTELVASGRSQDEVQRIIKASADIASTGLISMDTAVQSLNRSLSGEVGALSRVLPQLKKLTKEELESGKAIDEINKSFGGLAESTASQMTQVANAWGDFKEELGRGLSPALIATLEYVTKVIQRVFEKGYNTGFYEKLAEQLKTITKQYKEIKKSSKNGAEQALEDTFQKWDTKVLEKFVNDLNKLSKEKQKKFLESKGLKGDDFNKVLEALKKEYAIRLKLKQLEEQNAKYVETYRPKSDKELKDEKAKIEKEIQDKINLATKTTNGRRQSEINEQIKTLRNQYDAIEQLENERAIKQKQKDEELRNERDKLRKEYDETIRKAQEEIAQRRALGEEITKEAEAQEMCNVATSAYIKMMSNPAFKGNSGNYEHEVNARKQIANWSDEAKKKAKIDDFISLYGDNEKTLKEQIEELNKAYNEIIDLTDKSEQEKYKIKETYAKKLQELEQAITAENIAQVQKVFDYMNTMFGNLTSSINTFSDIGTQNAKNNADVRLAELEKEYSQGIVSEEDYYKQKEKIEKDQAKKTYKMQMWAWGAQVLQSQASMAQSMLQVLADETITSTYAKIAMMATIGALGAAQIAQAIASKPIPPSFATGGIVPGSSYTGDKISANVNSGEMILNERQQLQLWKTANGAMGAGPKLNVMIKNYLGDNADVKTQLNGNDLIVTIDKIVQQGLSSGKYSDALTSAQNKQNGIRYIS